MADSIRLQILGKVIAALSVTGGPAGLSVHRERTRAIELDSFPAILVYFSDDATKPISSSNRAPLTLNEMDIAVECRAEATAGLTPDQALDPLTTWADQKIFGNEQFDGLANQVVKGRTTWFSKEGDRAIASATIYYRIQYRTNRIDPTART